MPDHAGGDGIRMRSSWATRRSVRLAGMFVVGLAAPVAAQQMHAIGNAVTVQGQVLVTSHGEMAPTALKEGDQLFEGDHIETAGDGRARLVLEDGSLVQIGSSSAIDLEWVLYAPALDSRNVILSVPAGMIRFIVEALVPRSSFEVKTQTAVASVTGTDWVVVAKTERTSILTIKGEVAVQNLRPDVLGRVVLGAGHGTVVKPGEAPLEPKAWPAKRRKAWLQKTEVP